MEELLLSQDVEGFLNWPVSSFGGFLVAEYVIFSAWQVFAAMEELWSIFSSQFTRDWDSGALLVLPGLPTKPVTAEGIL